jgi:pectate lyase
MKCSFINKAACAILLLCQFSVCLGTEAPDPADPNRYLNAVREFADNVLKYGRDTYGPKHTPLFVDGLNIHTHEPVKWISPKGEDPLTATETEEWILSNFASQQTLLRTLDGLSTLTGDPKYRDAAMQAIKYAFANLRSPNGLFYWGFVAAYDIGSDKVRVVDNMHSVKQHHPYYELMWEVDSEATQKLIEAFWSAHVLDWSILDFDRIALFSDVLEEPWNYEYKKDPVLFNSKRSWACGAFFTGTSLAYSGATLYELSGQQQPLLWSKRIVERFVDARNPKSGVSHILGSAYC